MANAFLVPPVPEEQKVVLELTRHEATALLGICARIGGPPGGYRGIFSDGKNSISEVLGKALGKVCTDVADEWVAKGVLRDFERRNSFYFEC